MSVAEAERSSLVVDAAGVEVEVEVVAVTPRLAQEWLGRNSSNRRLRDATVRGYAEAMSRGEWRAAAGEPIYFNEEGTLENGQHRLAAQVAAGATVTHIVRRSSDGAQDVADTGIGRKLADVLRLRGEKNYAMLAATLRRIATYERLGNFATGAQVSALGLTNPLLLARYDRDREGIREAISYGDRVKRAGVPLAPSIASALYYAIAKVDEGDAEVFFDLLSTGSGLVEGDAIFALRRTLAQAKLRTHGNALPTQYQAALVIKGFNAWRRGDEVRVLSWRPRRSGQSGGERFPDIEDLP